MDAADSHGVTPLFTATEHGHEACVSLLLAAGAKVDAADSHGVTPLFKATQIGREACVTLLLQAGANVNAEDHRGQGPLHYAARYGSEASVALLLKAGADVTAADKDGWTPLHSAVEGGGEACATMLIAAGADVNAAASRGTTPLHCAARSGSCVSLLLQAGARCYADDADRSPLDVAVASRVTSAVALLAAAVPRVEVDAEVLDEGYVDPSNPRGDGTWWQGMPGAREEAWCTIMATLQGESRWRRRRPLALIREQRRAVRDAGRRVGGSQV